MRSLEDVAASSAKYVDEIFLPSVHIDCLKSRHAEFADISSAFRTRNPHLVVPSLIEADSPVAFRISDFVQRLALGWNAQLAFPRIKK